MGGKLAGWLAGVMLAVVAAMVPCCGDASPDRIPWILEASWVSYRQHFISPDGRVVLTEQGDGTISEAQAYALLRALWAGDEETFARVVTWTRANLSREREKGDHLLAWQWGKKPDGSWGVLDWNSASDADLDYALALLLASRQGWRPPSGSPDYLAQARLVAQDILDKEVVEVPGVGLYLAPGNWRAASSALSHQPFLFFPRGVPLFRHGRL